MSIKLLAKIVGYSTISDTEHKLPEDRNMTATIAAEEVFAIPNAIIASEIMEAAGDVLSPVVEDIIGDSVIDLLADLGADSIVELLVGEALNGITGMGMGTLAGLTYSAYRCGAFWIAPTVRSAAALICGMLGGLFASTLLKYLWEIGVVAVFFEDGDHEAQVDNMFSIAWFGSTLFGAVGAFVGRLNAIKLCNKFMSKYFPPESVKSKVE